MARPTRRQADDLILKHLRNEGVTVHDIAKFWMCSEKRVYQMIGELAYRYTNNNRCRDGVLLAQLRLQSDMANRRPMYDNTPEAFYYYERDRPAHPDMV